MQPRPGIRTCWATTSCRCRTPPTPTDRPLLLRSAMGSVTVRYRYRLAGHRF